VDRLATTP